MRGTASTSPSATSPRTIAPICSCSTSRGSGGSSCGAVRAWSRTIRRCWRGSATRAIARGPSARSCSRSRPGTATAPSTSLRASPKPRWAKPLWRWYNGSPRWRRRTRGCARRVRRRRRDGGPSANAGAPLCCGAKGGAGMDHDNYDDGYIRGILNTVRTIAMVGVSANTSRPSYFAFKYLLERGYRMIPVNPSLAGQELLGRKAYAALAEIPEPVDMVDIFRASQYALAIVREALALKPRPKVIWMQLGIL